MREYAWGISEPGDAAREGAWGRSEMEAPPAKTHARLAPRDIELVTSAQPQPQPSPHSEPQPREELATPTSRSPAPPQEPRAPPRHARVQEPDGPLQLQPPGVRDTERWLNAAAETLAGPAAQRGWVDLLRYGAYRAVDAGSAAPVMISDQAGSAREYLARLPTRSLWAWRRVAGQGYG